MSSLRYNLGRVPLSGGVLAGGEDVVQVVGKAAGTAGRDRLRASHADREHVIDALKAAFVQGRLAKDEFDARVGRAFTARTYADLAAITADVPAALAGPAPSRQPAGPQARPQADPNVKLGVRVTIGAIAVAVPAWAVVIYTEPFFSGISPPPVALMGLALLITTLGATATVVVSSVLTVAMMIESQRHKRSGRELVAPVTGAGDGGGLAAALRAS